MANGTLVLEDIHRARAQLVLSFRLDALRFSTAYWYSDVDLPALEAQYGPTFMEKVYVHIALFEINKLVSLRPRALDLGRFARHHTPALEALWRAVVKNVWAQWRYEHDLPGYLGPDFVSRPEARPAADAVVVEPGPVDLLAFCGGGKDSLVALKLLERANVPHGSYAYAHSVYGPAAPQHALIEGLLDHAAPARRHRHWVYDDFLDSPAALLCPEYGARYLLAAETPASLFGALPVLLAHGYRSLVLAHERSANAGNLVWDRTGETVNHQWGKGFEAERLLDAYVRAELLANARYFSVLQPIHDVVIFNLLRQDLAAVPATHSCNVKKPWCGECPKCAYVWAHYMAWLPTDLVNGVFGRNLFDVPANQVHYRQMLGLEAHTPFECIGEVDEARLAFELCRRKGLTGRAMEQFVAHVPRVDPAEIARPYLEVRPELSAIPPELARVLVPQMRAAADKCREELARE